MQDSKSIEICLPFNNKTKIHNQIKNGIKKIIISQRFEDKNSYDLEFLKDINGLNNIEILHICANCNSFAFLDFFSNLIELHIGNGSAIQKIDLSKCTRLKVLNIAGKFSVNGIEFLQLDSISISDTKYFPFDKLNNGIKELYLRNVKIEFKDLFHIKSLIKLEIIQIKNDSLTGLDFNNLEYLSVAYCSKLSNYSFLKDCKKIKYMELEKCKHIPTNLLRELVKIEKLILIDCGEIDSLDFIDGLQNLKFFSFYGTTVLSGDLTPCLKLDYVSTNNKKSYNIKDKDLPKNY